jgi:hypothetical protein
LEIGIGTIESSLAMECEEFVFEFREIIEAIAIVGVTEGFEG